MHFIIIINYYRINFTLKLEINKDEFFMNNFRAIKHTIKKVLEKLRKTPEKSRWSDAALKKSLPSSPLL